MAASGSLLGGEATGGNAPQAASAVAPARGRPRKKIAYKSKDTVDLREKSHKWYDNVNMNGPFSTSDKAILEMVNMLAANCIMAVKNNRNIEAAFQELNNRLQEMAGMKFLTPGLVKRSGVLEDEGLIQIFDGPDKAAFPWFMAADAEAIWRRWMAGDLDGFILRGINVTKGISESGRTQISYSIASPYLQKRSANVPGDNGLMNGEWWPLRICALRDGAHGKTEAGIHGTQALGALSIVVGPGKAHKYEDVDTGEVSHRPALSPFLTLFPASLSSLPHSLPSFILFPPSLSSHLHSLPSFAHISPSPC